MQQMQLEESAGISPVIIRDDGKPFTFEYKNDDPLA